VKDLPTARGSKGWRETEAVSWTRTSECGASGCGAKAPPPSLSIPLARVLTTFSEESMIDSGEWIMEKISLNIIKYQVM
jgi:hypothetical protein